ncbi:hypothetical protein [Listeria booriae]|uniref:Uncharacterized protein n=1 Tax=Listeria booriae TaxID=1552123 RepID=A0A7X0XXM4_9LIST|nr:hypothetical protein [Listeria booriae]MBC1793653.1 hypothetical protein [Listeria booriae]
MEKEQALLEQQLMAVTNKRRKLEDIQIELVELNRQKARILTSYSDAWQGNLAANTISRLEDDMELEWRATRKNVNMLEDNLIEEKHQIRMKLEQLKEQSADVQN